MTIFHKNLFLRLLAMPPATQLSIDNLNLIILNSPSVHFHIVSQLWSYCRYKICADGGANRLFDTCISANKNTLDFIPDFIVGDLDSARTDVIDYYRLNGCQTSGVTDQESNDLDKAICLLRQLLESEGRVAKDELVIIIGASGGRFDQEMATLHCLHKWRGNFLRIILLNEVSLTFLLESNQKHQLEIMKGIEGPTCGLIPLAGRADSVTTTGLEWNLNAESLQLGVRISTSNRVRDDVDTVTVESSADLLWTCSLLDSTSSYIAPLISSMSTAILISK